LVQRAFDINFYWPSDCTQSGVLAHALGAGAIVAGRDLEGVGETLKEAGEIVDTDLGHLVLKIQKIIFNPELAAGIEERVQNYAAEFSWENQVRRHYELAEHILCPSPVWSPSHFPLTANIVSVSTTDSMELAPPA
jgi:glycosyltransferase involved in cell wall biosynthesis